MGIVILTIPGEAKREFANSLYTTTGGKVDLVIIQKPKSYSLFKSLRKLYNRFPLKIFFKEIWYSLLLRLNKDKERKLSYFRERTGLGQNESSYLPKTLFVDSINSLEVIEALREAKPNLLVIWGTGIIKPSIISSAPKVINLHMGFCPHYRGALANQNAVLHKNIKRIGATIHFVEEKVDEGDILTTIAGDHSKPPRELFLDLNDQAERAFVEVAHQLFQGVDLPRTKQNKSRSKNLFLKDWLPSKRYELARYMKQWEEGML